MPEWNTSNANLIDALFWTKGAAEVDAAIGRLHSDAPLDYFEEVQIEGPPRPVATSWGFPNPNTTSSSNGPMPSWVFPTPNSGFKTWT
jgi:hypothetical protein